MKKNRIGLFVYLIALVVTTAGLAQDIQFTQFYASPLYLNPAFTGANVCSRFASNYRNQWPSIKKTYVTYASSFDHSLPKLNSGVGILFTNDKAGSGQLRTTSFSALYSYEALLTKKMAIRVGVQAGQTIRSINFYDLLFGDQIARGNAANSVEVPAMTRISYFDVSSGLLFYTRKFWIGFSALHITQPNQTLIEGESRLPTKYSIHSGYNLPVGSPAVKRSKKGNFKETKQSISPAINFRSQNKFSQLDIGFYYNYKPMVLGAWYRGIPILKAYKSGYPNNDAFSIIAGFEVREFKFGYSYDMTISALVASSGGAHEISIAYQFCDYAALSKKQKKRNRTLIIPCAKF